MSYIAQLPIFCDSWSWKPEDLSSCYLTASSDGTLRKWDIKNIKEEKVIELEESESEIMGGHMPCMVLVNDDKWVACFSTSCLAIYDLETGLYLKKIDLNLKPGECKICYPKPWMIPNETDLIKLQYTYILMQN